jgi:transcriptional regulator with XRE-family HTH domain
MNISEEFSARLREVMNERRLSMADLARLLHTQPSTLTRWFRGSRPQRNSLNALAEVLRVRPEWLAEGRGPRDARAEDGPGIHPGATLAKTEENAEGSDSDGVLRVVLSVFSGDELVAAIGRISSGTEPLSRTKTQALVAIARELHTRPSSKTIEPNT